MPDQRVWRRSPFLAWSATDSSLFVLDVSGGKTGCHPYCIEGGGQLIFEAIDGQRDSEAIAEAVANVLGFAPETLEIDVNNFLEELNLRGWILAVSRSSESERDN